MREFVVSDTECPVTGIHTWFPVARDDSQTLSWLDYVTPEQNQKDKHVVASWSNGSEMRGYEQDFSWLLTSTYRSVSPATPDTKTQQ
jgi:hypothetical protein